MVDGVVVERLLFFPQKSELNAFPCKIFVDLRKIWLRVRTRQSVLPWEKKLLNHLVGNVVVQRPGDFGFLRLVKYIGNRVTRAVQLSLHRSLTMPFDMQS